MECERDRIGQRNFEEDETMRERYHCPSRRTGKADVPLETSGRGMAIEEMPASMPMHDRHCATRNGYPQHRNGRRPRARVSLKRIYESYIPLKARKNVQSEEAAPETKRMIVVSKEQPEVERTGIACQGNEARILTSNRTKQPQKGFCR